MRKLLCRVALGALFAVPLLTAAEASAQLGPTPEGTEIVNTATVTWTDANGNSYTPVSASASVFVGFAAGIDVETQATATPSSPSTANQLPITITNVGNGIDTVSISSAVPAGITVTGYEFNGTTYATLEELNAALDQFPLAQGQSIIVTMIYSVGPGLGGQDLLVTITASSQRTPAVTDASTTTITPETSRGVVVTPDDGLVQQTAGNTVAYSETFTIQNQGNASDTFTLLASGSPQLTIASVNGTPGAQGSITLAAGQTATFTVTYFVAPNTPSGTNLDLNVQATSTAAPATVFDGGHYTIQVIAAGLDLSKVAYLDNQATEITQLVTVVPGDFVQYLITVTNNSNVAATNVVVNDVLPSQVQFAGATGDGPGWTIDANGQLVTATLDTDIAPGTSRSFWLRVQVR
jgi:uncharacterized repeat protein (TIGR01451 family)